MDDDVARRSTPVWVWILGGVVGLVVLIGVVNFIVSQVIAAVQFAAVVALLIAGVVFVGRRLNR